MGINREIPMIKKKCLPRHQVLAATLHAFSVMTLALAGSMAHALPVYVPGEYAATTGDGKLNTTINPSPRTYQMQFAASELTRMVGHQINGLSWRLDHSSAGGGGVRTWANYQITLAQAANSIAGMSSTFAANMLNPIMVRSGGLSLNLADFSASGGPPRPFGSLISFSTPYIYTGGDLVVLVSHTAATGDTSTNDFLDALSNTAPGYNTLFRALVDNTFQSTTATTSQSFNVTITQLDSDIPEPGSLALFGAGLTASLAASRRKAAQA